VQVDDSDDEDQRGGRFMPLTKSRARRSGKARQRVDAGIGAARDLGETIEHRLRDLDVEERAEALAESLATARERIQDLSVDLGQRATRGRRQATKRSAEAARIALEQARAAAEHLPDREDVAELTRRAGERLFRERAAARRKAERRRMGKLAALGAALAGVGLAIGWLTAPRRGPAADQVDKLRGSGEPLAPVDMRAETDPPADVALVPGSGNGSRGDWDGPRSD
jgi:hypothetical protein